ncbi:MAG: pimeloyl-ACP methyl ester esterase BioH [Chromatiales bacterium]|jgi:pimeloyl-[acyl-carrier protein] methyl ester esterase|nr:pimeloyl-ACP methyl ester esterase BioH [Chromatiales bacterium]MDX9767367.1 pimeloyl-ACP methyl ester esterase BioH [Ectothiorhodospiraceae bacterium]
MNASSPLHKRVVGFGPDLVLLHGWGLQGAVWDPLLPALSEHRRVSVIDLPGHGHSRDVPLDQPPEQALAALAASLPQAPVDLIGWSLGGMLALALAAAHPERVRRLVMVAALPRFVQGPGWPQAMSPELLEQFAAVLADGYKATLTRFLALQFHGVEGAAEKVRGLRDRLLEPAPDPDALRGGLSLLTALDLRDTLRDLPLPVSAIFGQRDMLVPAAAAAILADLRPGLRTTVLEGAGHAPFLSHPQAFLHTLESHLDD